MKRKIVCNPKSEPQHPIHNEQFEHIILPRNFVFSKELKDNETVKNEIIKNDFISTNQFSDKKWDLFKKVEEWHRCQNKVNWNFFGISVDAKVTSGLNKEKQNKLIANFKQMLEQKGVSKSEFQLMCLQDQKVFFLPEALAVLLNAKVKPKAKTKLARYFRGKDDKIYIELLQTFVIRKFDSNDNRPVIKEIPGEVRVVYRLTSKGPQFQYMSASNSVLYDLLTKQHNGHIDTLITKAAKEEYNQSIDKLIQGIVQEKIDKDVEKYFDQQHEKPNNIADQRLEYIKKNQQKLRRQYIRKILKKLVNAESKIKNSNNAFKQDVLSELLTAFNGAKNHVKRLIPEAITITGIRWISFINTIANVRKTYNNSIKEEELNKKEWKKISEELEQLVNKMSSYTGANDVYQRAASAVWAKDLDGKLGLDQEGNPSAENSTGQIQTILQAVLDFPQRCADDPRLIMLFAKHSYITKQTYQQLDREYGAVVGSYDLLDRLYNNLRYNYRANVFTLNNEKRQKIIKQLFNQVSAVLERTQLPSATQSVLQKLQSELRQEQRYLREVKKIREEANLTNLKEEDFLDVKERKINIEKDDNQALQKEIFKAFKEAALYPLPNHAKLQQDARLVKDTYKTLDKIKKFLKSYLKEAHGLKLEKLQLKELDFEGLKASTKYSISSLSKNQKRNKKIYHSVLALRMIQVFEEHHGDSVNNAKNLHNIQDYEAIITAMRGILECNNDSIFKGKNRFANGGFFSHTEKDYNGKEYTVMEKVEGMAAILGQEKRSISKRPAVFSTDLGLKLNATEKEQYAEHNAAKSWIFRSSNNFSVLTKNGSDFERTIVKSKAFVKEYARQLNAASDVETLKEIKKSFDKILLATLQKQPEVDTPEDRLRKAYSRFKAPRYEAKKSLNFVYQICEHRFNALKELSEANSISTIEQLKTQFKNNIYQEWKDVNKKLYQSPFKHKTKLKQNLQKAAQVVYDQYAKEYNKKLSDFAVGKIEYEQKLLKEKVINNAIENMYKNTSFISNEENLESLQNRLEKVDEIYKKAKKFIDNYSNENLQDIVLAEEDKTAVKEQIQTLVDNAKKDAVGHINYYSNRKIFDFQLHPALPSINQAAKNYNDVTSDHVPVLSKIRVGKNNKEISVLFWNALEDGDFNSGFAINGIYGEANEPKQCSNRHKLIAKSISRFLQKHKPDFICLQEINWPLENQKKSSLYEKVKDVLNETYDVVNSKNNRRDCITFFNKEKYDVNKENSPHQEGNIAHFINKQDKNSVEILNTHFGGFAEVPTSREKIINEFLLSQKNEQKEELNNNKTSIVIGDFNAGVAQIIRDFKSEDQPSGKNIVTSATTPKFLEYKLQGGAPIDGCFYTTDGKKIQQADIDVLNPATGEKFTLQELSPLTVPGDNKFTSSQREILQEEINKPWVLIAVDDFYKTEKLINNMTIFDYEKKLRTDFNKLKLDEKDNNKIFVRPTRDLNNTPGLAVVLPSHIAKKFFCSDNSLNKEFQSRYTENSVDPYCIVNIKKGQVNTFVNAMKKFISSQSQLRDQSTLFKSGNNKPAQPPVSRKNMVPGALIH